MDNKKTNQYYVNKIVADLTFIIDHTDGLSKKQLEENEVLLDSVMFRLIQISENADKLCEEFKNQYPSVRWHAIKGMRNRNVHEYGNIDLFIVYRTLREDIPALLQSLKEIM